MRRVWASCRAVRRSGNNKSGHWQRGRVHDPQRNVKPDEELRAHGSCCSRTRRPNLQKSPRLIALLLRWRKSNPLLWTATSPPLLTFLPGALTTNRRVCRNKVRQLELAVRHKTFNLLSGFREKRRGRELALPCSCQVISLLMNTSSCLSCLELRATLKLSGSCCLPMAPACSRNSLSFRSACLAAISFLQYPQHMEWKHATDAQERTTFGKAHTQQTAISFLQGNNDAPRKSLG